MGISCFSVGVAIGLLLTNLVTTGNATAGLSKATTDSSGLVEARQDLILNLLKVNRIENRNDNPLVIGSTNQVNINATQMPISVAGNFEVEALNAGIFGQQIVEISSADEIRLHADQQVTIDAPFTQFTNLIEVSNNTVTVYYVGDTIGIGDYTVAIMNIWDANNAVEMQLRNDVNGIIAEDVYSEGDIIFDDYLPINLVIDEIFPDSVGIAPESSSEAGYYMCIRADGTIYKNMNPCN